jgi:holo-[acyl-carrier protein] synthase
MIIGIGVDILDIKRIERALAKYGERFKTRIFKRREIEFCMKRTRAIESFSKMFAIKEAVIKAVSVSNGISWHDIEVLHDSNGRPEVLLTGRILQNLNIKIHNQAFRIAVSVSDEIPYVCAFAVLEVS